MQVCYPCIMKTQHTHQGTCQACGAVQAVDNTTQLIAKHGYTVSWGMFNGTCPGSDKLSAEREVTFTKHIITICIESGNDKQRIADLYASGDLMVYTWDVSTWVRGTPSKGGHYVTKNLPMFGCSDAQVDSERAHTVYGYENVARMQLGHAESLTKNVLPRLGQPLFAVADQVKPVKPVDGKVNVKAGKIEGAFHTKAAQKNALEAIAHAYEKEAKLVMQACLASGTGEHGGRLPAAEKLYFDFPSHAIANYRPRHSVAVLAVFPGMTSVVTEMERLVALRLEVKSRPVVKGGAK